MLLIARDGAPLDPEDVEEVVVEALCPAFLMGFVLPLFGKGGGREREFRSRRGESWALLWQKAIP